MRQLQILALLGFLALGFNSCDQTTSEDIIFTKEFTGFSTKVDNETVSQSNTVGVSDANKSGLSSSIDKATVKSITVEVFNSQSVSKLSGDIKYGKYNETIGKPLIVFKDFSLLNGTIQTFQIDSVLGSSVGTYLVQDEKLKLYLNGLIDKQSSSFSLRITVTAKITLNPGKGVGL